MIQDSIGLLIGCVLAPFILVAMGVIIIAACIDEIGKIIREKIEVAY